MLSLVMSCCVKYFTVPSPGCHGQLKPFTVNFALTVKLATACLSADDSPVPLMLNGIFLGG